MSKQYDNYLLQHIGDVTKALMWMNDHDFIDEDTMDVAKRHVRQHDKSKYFVQEYVPYDNYFYGDRTDEVKEAFDFAWLHHIHNNPHHWQYWVLVRDEGTFHGLEMPKEYVYEMIADWWSFSWKSGNLYDIFEWYATHGPKMILHPNTRKLVDDILDKINKILDQENN